MLVVPASQCREFMQHIAPPEMWPILLAEQNWGGHLHRAILVCATSDVEDNELVDVIPPYIDAILADSRGRLPERLSNVEKKELAIMQVKRNLEAVSEPNTEDPLGSLEESLLYVRQAEVRPYLWERLTKRASEE